MSAGGGRLYAQAARDFAFQPKGFVLAAEDVPA